MYSLAFSAVTLTVMYYFDVLTIPSIIAILAYQEMSPDQYNTAWIVTVFTVNLILDLVALAVVRQFARSVSRADTRSVLAAFAL
jgi:putative effector of murein hydrolase LrgA (UPF0299 family)